MACAKCIACREEIGAELPADVRAARIVARADTVSVLTREEVRRVYEEERGNYCRDCKPRTPDDMSAVSESEGD